MLIASVLGLAALGGKISKSELDMYNIFSALFFSTVRPAIQPAGPLLLDCQYWKKCAGKFKMLYRVLTLRFFLLGLRGLVRSRSALKFIFTFVTFTIPLFFDLALLSGHTYWFFPKLCKVFTKILLRSSHETRRKGGLSSTYLCNVLDMFFSRKLGWIIHNLTNYYINSISLLLSK